MRISIGTDPADGLEARDREELARLLGELLDAEDDEHAWHPMRRARLLVARARLVVRGGRMSRR